MWLGQEQHGSDSFHGAENLQLIGDNRLYVKLKSSFLNDILSYGAHSLWGVALWKWPTKGRNNLGLLCQRPNSTKHKLLRSCPNEDLSDLLAPLCLCQLYVILVRDKCHFEYKMALRNSRLHRYKRAVWCFCWGQFYKLECNLIWVLYLLIFVIYYCQIHVHIFLFFLETVKKPIKKDQSVCPLSCFGLNKMVTQICKLLAHWVWLGDLQIIVNFLARQEGKLAQRPANNCL